MEQEWPFREKGENQAEPQGSQEGDINPQCVHGVPRSECGTEKPSLLRIRNLAWGLAMELRNLPPSAISTLTSVAVPRSFVQSHEDAHQQTAISLIDIENELDQLARWCKLAWMSGGRI